MWQDHTGLIKPIASENGLYSLEIEAPERRFSNPSVNPGKQPEILIFDHQGDRKELLWHKAAPWAAGEVDFFRPFRSRAYLTNDGKAAVVLIDVFGDAPILHIVSKDNESILDMSDLLAVLEIGADEKFQFNWRVSQESLDVLGTFDARAFYGLWLGSMKQWAVTPLDEPSFKIPSPELRTQLQRQMLQHCREEVQIYEEPKAARERAKDVIDFSEIKSAYRFLAMNGDPVDRAAAERLVATQFKRGGTTCSPFGFPTPGPPLDFSSHDRALGAELLTTWAVPDIANSSGVRASKSTVFGEVAGVIFFPFRLPIPPGTLALSITPLSETVEGGDSTPIRVEFALPDELPHAALQQKGPRPNQLGFRVGTLTPGEYRLKALWERPIRTHLPPWIEKNATPDSKGGSYESAESDPVSVRGGETAGGIQLECFYRASGDPSLYTNDRFEERSIPPSKNEIRAAASQFSPSQTKVNTLFSGPAREALKKEEQSEAKIILREMRLEQFSNGGANGRKELSVTFVHLGLKNRKLRFESELRDDQGTCYYGSVNEFDAIKEVCFSVVPFRSKHFELSILTFDEENSNYDGTALPTYRDTFQLQNTLPVSEIGYTPEQLPASKVLDLVTVVLSEVKPIPCAEPGSRKIEPVFMFYEEGREAPSWRVSSLSYEDSIGNISSSTSGLPASESVLKLRARFTREIHAGRFNKQEQWQIEIPRIPTGGGFLELQCSWEFPGGSIKVLGIGGPGVFRYNEGKVLFVRDLSSEENERLRIDEIAVYGEMDSYLFSDSGFRESGPLSDSGECEVRSLWPYLVFQKTVSKRGIEIGVKEKRRSEYSIFFRAAEQQRKMVFVPLDYQPGDSSKTVTIVAQQPREVEFVIRRPG